jgi:hypothetical protein
MSIWAGIKHALNSSLGTSDFQPLDKLIRFEGKKLVASDNPFLTVPIIPISVSPETGKTSSAYANICTITPLVGGSARLSANVTIRVGDTGSTTYASISVYVNGVNKYTFIQSHSYSTGAVWAADRVITGDFTFNANDEITFKLQSYVADSSCSGSATLNSMKINATTIDNLMEVR